MNEVQEEYNEAKAEKRQPNCPYCHQPLEVIQVQYEVIRWIWDGERKKFSKDDDQGDADKPYCDYCGVKDWDFVDFDLVDF